MATCYAAQCGQPESRPKPPLRSRTPAWPQDRALKSSGDQTVRMSIKGQPGSHLLGSIRRPAPPLLFPLVFPWVAHKLIMITSVNVTSSSNVILVYAHVCSLWTKVTCLAVTRKPLKHCPLWTVASGTCRARRGVPSVPSAPPGASGRRSGHSMGDHVWSLSCIAGLAHFSPQQVCKAVDSGLITGEGAFRLWGKKEAMGPSTSPRGTTRAPASMAPRAGLQLLTRHPSDRHPGTRGCPEPQALTHCSGHSRVRCGTHRGHSHPRTQRPGGLNEPRRDLGTVACLETLTLWDLGDQPWAQLLLQAAGPATWRGSGSLAC